MSKMSRSQLKMVIKECLIEILAEGFGAAGAETLREASKNTQRSSGNARRQMQEAPRKKSERVNENFKNAIKESVGMLTDDPIMQSIFADTALSTLQEQNANETPGRGATNLNTAAPSSQVPIDIFEGGKDDRWAKLAFAEENNRK